MAIFIVDTNNYLSDIMNSYGNNVAKMYHQYRLDYKRMSIYCNNSKIKSIAPFIKKVSDLCAINNTLFHLSDIILLLCTQAAHAHSFITVRDMFGQTNNIAVCSHKTSFDLKMNLNNDPNYLIILHSYFLLKDINTSKIVNKIHAELRIIFNKKFNDKSILVVKIM